MSNQNFEVGKIVTLKSGGPEMTINKVMENYEGDSTRLYRCQWFAGKKLDSGDFPSESLIEVISEA
jgi:uncharacterized protein YodC (DUF2158 family)